MQSTRFRNSSLNTSCVMITMSMHASNWLETYSKVVTKVAQHFYLRHRSRSHCRHTGPSSFLHLFRCFGTHFFYIRWTDWSPVIIETILIVIFIWNIVFHHTLKSAVLIWKQSSTAAMISMETLSGRQYWSWISSYSVRIADEVDWSTRAPSAKQAAITIIDVIIGFHKWRKETDCRYQRTSQQLYYLRSVLRPWTNSCYEFYFEQNLHSEGFFDMEIS